MKKLKKFLMVVAAIVGMSQLTGCMDSVPVGNVGIKVYKMGGSKGVDQEVLGVGRYWIGINEDLYLFPTTVQNYVFTQSADEGKASDESMSFQTADGMTIGTDIGVSYTVDPSKITRLFQKYRLGLNEITSIHIRNAIRDQLNTQGSKDSINALIGGGKGRLFKNVQDSVAHQFDSLGIREFKLYIVGKFRWPENIEKSINTKVAATQASIQAENELALAKAEAAKKIAEAEGEARANALKQSSITPQLIQMEAIKKWDGKLPTYSGGSLPFINLGTTKQFKLKGVQMDPFPICVNFIILIL